MNSSPAASFPTSANDTASGPSPDPSDSGGATSVPEQAATAGRDSELLGRVVHGLHQAIDRLADGAAPHVQRLQRQVETAGDIGGEWVESLRGTVRERPLTAVIGALLAGLVIARLNRR